MASWIAIILISTVISVLLILLFTPNRNSIQEYPKQDSLFVKIDGLVQALDLLPGKVLHTVTGSANTHKGALGELIGYIQLRASYDRIIPLGNIVDFVGIKFPTEDCEGHIDFIDIKTGDKSRLSKDQRNLQKLIDSKKINFIKLKVETSHENNTRTD